MYQTGPEPSTFRASYRRFLDAHARASERLARAKKIFRRARQRELRRSFAAGFCSGALAMAVVAALIAGVLAQGFP
jgi:hypothetical protein